jgi:high-affinity nickel-transport protein
MTDELITIANTGRSLAARAAPAVGLLILANTALWIAAFVLMQGHPILLGTSLLAYLLGLRHAIDPDHLAAIDNVTRKFASEGKAPLGIGFYFALGHSAFVLFVVLVLSFTATQIHDQRFIWLEDYGALISAIVSTLFLLSIGVINLKSLISMRRAHADHAGPRAMNRFWTRWITPLFARITRSHGMILIGFLFALSFDTATEISLFSLGAAQGLGHALNLLQMLILPLLFASGMALIDTLNGIAMLGAYQWAMANPAKHRIYNLIVTGLSVLLAFAIGLIGLAHYAYEKWGFGIGFDWLTDHSDLIGIGIIALFIIIWSTANLVARVLRLRNSAA